MAATEPYVTTKAHCNACGHDTNHDVLCAKETKWEDYDPEDHYGVDGWDRYELIQCRGCDGVSMRHTSYFSEDGQPRETQYPPQIARRAPQWRGELRDDDVGGWLDEIYIAVQSGSRRLATMGIRALLEHVMISKVGDHGTFAQNVREFERAGYVTSNHADSLSTILEAGHATIHRDWMPSNRDIATLLDITESILATVYIHGDKLHAVRRKVPPRRPRT